jgi:hypothetical protein
MRLLAGKPLLWHTLDAVRRSKIDYMLVCTGTSKPRIIVDIFFVEDEEMQQYSKTLG